MKLVHVTLLCALMSAAHAAEEAQPEVAGKPCEATVVDGTGDPAFAKAALASVDKWQFEPASLDGKPIDAGFTQKITFLLTDKPGAHPHFIKLYQQVLEAVQAGDRASADSRFALMSTYNLYEDACRSMAYYMYYRKWGTETQQLEALRRAIAGEESATYLPKDLFISALQGTLALEIRAQDYARALQTWEKLHQAYAVPGEMGTGTSWYYELLKRKFQIEVASRKIAEIKLRCDRQYVFFHFDPKLQYTIGGNDRSCSMEVVGDPGTKFRLTQL